MNTVQASEHLRKRMEAISDKINRELGSPKEPLHSEPNKYDVCPVCNCPLRIKYGKKDGHQRFRCVACGKQYFGEDE
jgi:hypothetical protein